MKDVLIVTDSRAVSADVRAVLSDRDFSVRDVTAGADVLGAIHERQPDLVVCDFQIGNMGGVATTLDLRLEQGAGRIGDFAIVLLLDRRADVFLARRCEADGYVVKPLDPIRLRRAISAVLDGDTYEDASYRPAESAAAH